MARASGGARSFRTDVQGLRAVAVAAVVLFHAGVPGLQGGFVGVDVFFVISGYLITGQLVAEVGQRGRLDFAGFYARRIRRLLPASALVLLVTVAAGAVVLSPLRARSVNLDAVWAGGYGLNYRLAWQGTDYLSAGAPPSPLQHYWSLGLEEQFYLLWPLLLVGASRLWRRRCLRVPALALVLGASLAYCVHLTSVSQPEAFFWLPSRAWEFAAGGLVAVSGSPGRRVMAQRPRVAAVLSWSGLAGIVAAVALLGPGTAYPGTAALLPVTATAAVLAGGGTIGTRGAARVLALRPLQVLGGLSYGTYLWHWPLLILAPIALGRPLALWQSLTLAAASVVLAALTLLLLERPLRTAGALARRPVRSFALGAGLTALACLLPLALSASAPALRGPGAAATTPSLAGVLNRAEPGTSRSAAPTVAHASVHKASPTDPAAARLTTLERAVDQTIIASLGNKSVPANLTPGLDVAAGDKATPFLDGCHLGYTGSVNATCAYGDTSSATRVLLVGDSHAVQWFPAMQQLAQARRWRLESLTKSICPPVILAIWQPGEDRPYTECTDWRTSILARIRAEKPALVVLGSARHYGPEYRFTVYSKAWDEGWSSMVGDIRADGVPVLVLGPAALPRLNIPECLAGHLGDAGACGRFEDSAINAGGVDGERAAVTAAGGTYADVSSWMCAAGHCPALVGNLLVYRDDNHLTTSYAAYLTPLLSAEVDIALGR